MLVNKFASRCSYCGKRVDPNAGVCWKPDGAVKWITAHESCVPGPLTSPARTTPKASQGNSSPEPMMGGKPPAIKLRKLWYQDDDKDDKAFEDVPF